MADYISREDFLRWAREFYPDPVLISGIINAPAADVEPVTRCKDCKKSSQTESGERYCTEPMGAFYGCIPVEDNFFCSGGVRKEETV